MKRKRNLLAGAMAFLMALCLTLPAFADDAWTSGDVSLTVTYGQTEARTMLDMINAFRTGDEAFYLDKDNTTHIDSKGEPLTYSYALEEIAMQRAAEIALSFSHTRPDGTRALDTAFASDGTTSSWGENIAAGSSTAQGSFTQWREDDEDYSGQGHRRNMLNTSFKAVGIGHATVGGTHYWVQEFGYDTDSASATDADDTERAVTITVASSRVQSVGDLTASPETISVAESGTVNAPSVSASVQLANAWPSRATAVSVTPTWTGGNDSVFTVSGQTITGVKAGSANLSGAALGKTVSVPVTVTGEESPSARIYGNSLTLTGTIGVNFYLTLPADLTSDAAAYVTLNGEKRLIKDATHGGVADDPSGDYYTFTWSVPAKKMNDAVTLQVYAGNDTPYLLLDGNGVDYTNGYEYSVAAYLQKARELYASGALRELADAMSDYGSLAQTFFKYDTGNAATVSDAVASVTADSFADYEPVITTTDNSGVSYGGSNLTLESETTLRHFFKLDDGRTIDEYAVTLDGASVTPTVCAEGYCVEIKNITAKRLGDSHTFAVNLKSGGDALKIENYSALSYGWKALHGSSDDANLQNLVRGLYLYCQKAQAYFTE